jgi:hypothetical protein
MTAQITLACGIIAFPQAGPPLAESIPIPMVKVGPVVSVAS